MANIFLRKEEVVVIMLGDGEFDPRSGRGSAWAK
jgi:hypothetical protein